MSRKRTNNHNRRYSATELAALGRCEQQILFQLRGRREHVSSTLAAARRRGDTEHARRHKVLQNLANAPSNLDAVRQPDRRCFIATTIYGADVWQVHVLRAWRDRSLKKNILGRALVRAYYGCSPPLAAWLAHHPRAARWMRRLLDHWVRRVIARETNR